MGKSKGIGGFGFHIAHRKAAGIGCSVVENGVLGYICKRDGDAKFGYIGAVGDVGLHRIGQWANGRTIGQGQYRRDVTDGFPLAQRGVVDVYINIVHKIAGLSDGGKSQTGIKAVHRVGTKAATAAAESFSVAQRNNSGAKVWRNGAASGGGCVYLCGKIDGIYRGRLVAEGDDRTPCFVQVGAGRDHLYAHGIHRIAGQGFCFIDQATLGGERPGAEIGFAGH